jgi:DeoR/GlpR family transcriptional regulator of sugar metabolism
MAQHQEQEMVRTKRAMISAAERRVLLLDHNKIGKVALHRLAPLTDFDLIVVDSGATKDQLQDLEESGVPVKVAPL